MARFLEEVSKSEVTDLFEYEDALKEALLNGQDMSSTLELVQERIKKIYVVPIAKSEQHI